MPGVDRLYLRSELLWRQGQLPAAMRDLRSTISSNSDSSKCCERLAYLEALAEQLRLASLAVDAGYYAVLLYSI